MKVKMKELTDKKIQIIYTKRRFIDISRTSTDLLFIHRLTKVL